MLEPQAHFDRLAWIEVSVSDSMESSKQGFWFSTTNHAPEITHLPRIDRHVGEVSIQIQSQISDLKSSKGVVSANVKILG